MHPEREIVDGIAAALQRRWGAPPPWAIVLGSGLGAVTDGLVGAEAAPAPEFGLPQSTVVGHAGRVVRGSLAGVDTLVLSGRVHLYEGHAPPVVVRGVRALAAWGVQRLVLTCSVGGIAVGLEPGALVCLRDHINLMGLSPLRGEAYATRFPDMTTAYDPAMRAALMAASGRRGVSLVEGVLAAMPGPAYETPAEVRMLRTLGADVVGMSTVPEVLAAAEVGLPCAGVALVSNRAAGLTAAALHHGEVTDVAGRAAVALRQLLEEVAGAW